MSDRGQRDHVELSWSDGKAKGGDAISLFLPQNGVREAKQDTSSPQLMKGASLVLLTAHYAVLVLTMRYLRTRPGALFVTSTTVLLAEVTKTLACFIIILVQERGIRQWAVHLYEELLCKPWDFLKVAVPSLIFVIQNNLVYYAVSDLDAATFQVTYQLKILTTAVCSRLLLGKRLSNVQWVSLFMLFVGVSIIQVQATSSSNTSSSSSSSASNSQSALRGLIAVLTCCFLSGFANVYFEKLLKGGKQSVWLRNIQLGISGTVLGMVAVWINDGPKIVEQGFFFGYDWLVWVTIMMQSFGGLLVAVVIKYADNILKGFSTATSILLSCIASVYFFDFQITKEFFTGTTLVILAVVLYSSYPLPQPTVIIEVEPTPFRNHEK